MHVNSSTLSGSVTVVVSDLNSGNPLQNAVVNIYFSDILGTYRNIARQVTTGIDGNSGILDISTQMKNMRIQVSYQTLLRAIIDYNFTKDVDIDGTTIYIQC